MNNISITLNKFIKLSVNWFVITVFLSSISSILLILELVLLSKIITSIIFYKANISFVDNEVIYFICCVFFQICTRSVSDITGIKAALKITKAIRLEIYQSLFRTGPISYSHISLGEMVNSLTEAVDNLLPYFARYIPSAVMMVILPLFILATVLNFDIWGFVILLCTGPLIPLFMALVGYTAQVIMDRQWRQLSLLSGNFFDMLKGLKTLRLFGRAGESLKFIEKLSDEYRKTTLSVMKVAFLTSAVLEFFSSLSIAVVAVTFGIRLLNGTMHFHSAFLVLLLAPEYFMPLRDFSSSYHARQNANAALDQLKKIYSLPKLIKFSYQNKRTDTGIREIILDHVTVKNKENINLVQDITCTFLRDRLNIIFGHSGAGKTMLLNILLGFLPIQSGTLRMVDLKNQSQSLNMVDIAWVPQEPLLLYGTIRDNLSLKAFEPSFEQLCSVANQAGILSFIETLPQGFETHIGEEGQNLSGGQIRRLMLARALLKNPDILILDEPTSGLDQKNALQIIQTIQLLKKDRIVIVATHNPLLIFYGEVSVQIDRGQLLHNSRVGGKSL
ncbi:MULTISPECIES: thiol reductant ABC exporter subunit CydD [unclassified Commensalibacter]|uniref:thiol reductant ABC exporter subunit CydD n=1 Tax=unclassified Commensalibacter TaxID=2630218 RepID=UPI0018DBB72B|nr:MULTISPECIES: thiol reductant ABC exporter subunit CydD [unclassified Commensalibacter]MBH9970079.1 thiol reductant ABC exporter subunit CydD [Commensalibacter sp. M0265]MBH9977735.1 thiol reductant ABC exporter subunit CydD [Commensalibacter sp. M0266]MBH9993114.1 thiol reductant ABC exporter subunit CydD [Commensalibacter sp. M0270]MBI0046911.1 thiol reductant ABC exporter subunit CydD [Commensalibacter sp. M0267]MBI0056279.1 thiol reductant ABC exporter subunit CydD [Commensalibacter sp.